MERSQAFSLLQARAGLVLKNENLIKYSIWQGYKSYDNEQYTKSIANLKRAVYLYPKKIGKMHMRLAEMYLIQNDSKKALEHALIAQDINPTHKSPKELIELIRNK